MSKKLVAYFSVSGNTKKLAGEIASMLDADTYEILPKEEYTKKDINWLNPFSRCMKEFKNKTRPELADDSANINQYDTVYVGFPIWCFIAPLVIYSFLENYDFAGKKVVLFATAGSSGFGKTKEKLKDSVPNATLIESRVVSRNCKKEELFDWIKENEVD